MNVVWTEAEKNFIRDNAGRLKDWEIAMSLTRLTGRHVTLHSIRGARHRLGIKKRPGRGVCEVRRLLPPDSGIGLTITATE
jgi:hypothetical protein